MGIEKLIYVNNSDKLTSISTTNTIFNNAMYRAKTPEHALPEKSPVTQNTKKALDYR